METSTHCVEPEDPHSRVGRVLERVLAMYHRAERHGGADRVATSLLDGCWRRRRSGRSGGLTGCPPDAEVLRILEDAEPELLGEGYHVITLRAPHDRRPAPRTGSTTAIRRRTSAVLAPITYRRAPRRLAEVVSGPIRELGVTEGGAHGGICTRPDRGGNGC